jgi:hypothetical protein
MMTGYRVQVTGDRETFSVGNQHGAGSQELGALRLLGDRALGAVAVYALATV